MSTRFTLTRRYLRAHVWLHRQCDRLSPKWQKRIVFGLRIVYSSAPGVSRGFNGR
ncbi:hypothetical protein [Tannerella serpentiformis]|uniref:hypothetical protein n=1 Tax=Tannerella serpentiformis TaxID=712710 RepID=UPI00131B4A4C|nr:hypothetical protein [Tannerella serpentiformis]